MRLPKTPPTSADVTSPLLGGKLTGFVLNIAMLVVTVGDILLIATLINKHLTKKEQEKEKNDSEK